MKQVIGVTLIPSDSQDVTGVYQSESGIDVVNIDDPYILSDGFSLADPLSVKLVDGEVFLDTMGNAQRAIPVKFSNPPIQGVTWDNNTPWDNSVYWS